MIQRPELPAMLATEHQQDTWCPPTLRPVMSSRFAFAAQWIARCKHGIIHAFTACTIPIDDRYAYWLIHYIQEFITSIAE